LDLGRSRSSPVAVGVSSIPIHTLLKPHHIVFFLFVENKHPKSAFLLSMIFGDGCNAIPGCSDPRRIVGIKSYSSFSKGHLFCGRFSQRTRKGCIFLRVRIKLGEKASVRIFFLEFTDFILLLFSFLFIYAFNFFTARLCVYARLCFPLLLAYLEREISYSCVTHRIEHEVELLERCFRLSEKARLSIFNGNRYEQHFPWKFSQASYRARYSDP
jgi:hypothetical protein